MGDPLLPLKQLLKTREQNRKVLVEPAFAAIPPRFARSRRRNSTENVDAGQA